MSEAADPTAEADLGRHPGFPSFNVLGGGPSSLALARDGCRQRYGRPCFCRGSEMPADHVLYTSEDVRAAVIESYRSAKGRRVAVTAFVGRGAQAYLPRPEGIELLTVA